MQKLRKITISNETFLWKRGHYHLKEYKISECAEKVVIYLEGYKNSPIQIHFIEDDNILLFPNRNNKKWCVGYPNSGIIWLFHSNKELKPQSKYNSINLNRPAVIAKIIDYFYNSIWKPQEQKSPTIIKNGLEHLNIISFPESE